MPIRRADSSHKDDKLVSDVRVEDLFNYGRAKQGSPLLHKILFMLWVPFGLVLVVARTLLFFVTCLSIITMPRIIGDTLNQFLLRLTFGLVVIHNHKGKPLSKNRHIVAANHVSDFDTFVMFMTTTRFHTLTSAHLKAIPIVGKTYAALDAIYVAPTTESRDKAKEEMKKRLETTDYPVLIFPEGGLTSGKKGTMMYSKFVFSLDCDIVPAAINLRDPWPVENDYLGSSWGKNFFYFMFVPFHICDLTFLEPQTRRADESPEDFAWRVQCVTSEFLKIQPTKHTYAMKKELAKKLKEKQSMSVAVSTTKTD